jgi:hypothetical protein
MRGVLICGAVALGLLGASARAATPKLHLQVGPAPLRVGTPVPVKVVGGPFQKVRVVAVSPKGRRVPVPMTSVGAGRWRGVVRFDRVGRWRIEAAGGALRTKVTVVIRPPLLTPPPKGFGPLGKAGCAPPSPRNGMEVFGTTAAGRFWALFGFNPSGTTWASDDTAALDGLVGKEIKIVFKLTAGQPSSFFAVSPSGTLTKPVWGPTPHGSSTWKRTGSEWGAGFVFTDTGCWRIHAKRGTTAGDIWLDIRS